MNLYIKFSNTTLDILRELRVSRVKTKSRPMGRPNFLQPQEIPLLDQMAHRRIKVIFLIIIGPVSSSVPLSPTTSIGFQYSLEFLMSKPSNGSNDFDEHLEHFNTDAYSWGWYHPSSHNFSTQFFALGLRKNRPKTTCTWKNWQLDLWSQGNNRDK